MVNYADYYSRLPLPSTINAIHKLSVWDEEEIQHGDRFDHFVMNQIKQLPVRAENISSETRKDPHLSKIIQTLETGQCLARFGYKAPKTNYTLQKDCLLLEHRVIDA